MSRTPTFLYNRIWAAVNQVESRLTPTDFGRLAQVLLALSFQEVGFSINHFQQVGRPDFLAEKGSQEYAVEVKAPVGSTVLLKEEDLLGVNNLGAVPMVAVLTYPDIDAQWLLLPSNSVSPHVYQKTMLKKYNMTTLSREVNESFLSVLDKDRDLISKGASNLRKLIRNAS
jgi:hypothetical protein